MELVQDTWIDATSFDLEFFGPDAATLNSIVQLSNAVGATIGDGNATVTILNDD